MSIGVQLIKKNNMNMVEYKYCGKRKSVAILLLLALMICGSCTQSVTEFGVVEGVETYNGPFEGYTYLITISDDFNAHWRRKVCIYTNKLYQIGDTIQITKKN